MKMPSRTRFRLYVKLLLLLSVNFIVVFGSTSWLAGIHEYKVQIYFDYELSIPLIPIMVFPYLSIFVLCILPLFLMDEIEMKCFAKTFAVVTWIAGISFLLFPSEVGYARIVNLPQYNDIYQVIRTVASRYNLFPSLHITYTCLYLFTLLPLTKRLAMKFILTVWGILLISSVLLIHQHHIFDIMTGMLLATWSYHYIYKKSLNSYALLPATSG